MYVYALRPPVRGRLASYALSVRRAILYVRTSPTLRVSFVKNFRLVLQPTLLPRWYESPCLQLLFGRHLPTICDGALRILAHSALLRYGENGEKGKGKDEAGLDLQGKCVYLARRASRSSESLL